MRFLFLVLLSLKLSGAEMSDLKVGSPFPGYQLENISNGKVNSVRSYFGKKTILHIYASW